jgi:hypothetical protein
VRAPRLRRRLASLGIVTAVFVAAGAPIWVGMLVIPTP